jgi:antitoxin component of RelBE/YafQ-DinJ toxin-antitoxin module
MKGNANITFVTSSELRAEVESVAATLGLTKSEFIRLAVIHAIKERPAEAFAARSGMRRKGNPNFGAKRVA